MKIVWQCMHARHSLVATYIPLLVLQNGLSQTQLVDAAAEVIGNAGIGNADHALGGTSTAQPFLRRNVCSWLGLAPNASESVQYCLYICILKALHCQNKPQDPIYMSNHALFAA